MQCQPTTDRPNSKNPSTASPADANEPTAASGHQPPPHAESPTTSGSATAAAAPTSFAETLALAAAQARRPAPTANSLCSSLEWFDDVPPGTRPTSLVVQHWIGQAAKLIDQYQDLLAVLAEMQVQTLNRHQQRNAQPNPEDE